MTLEEAYDDIWAHTSKGKDNYGKISGRFQARGHYYDIEIFTYAKSYTGMEPNIHRKTEVGVTHYDMDVAGNVNWDTIKTDVKYFYNVHQIEAFLRGIYRILYWQVDWRVSHYS